MFRTRRTLPLLLVALLAAAPAALAQEEQPEERPEVGFRALGPRTVISFVRQTVGPSPAGPVELPFWTSVVHVSNTGNAPMAAAAIFVPASGEGPLARRFGGIRPGQTLSFSVADLMDGNDAAFGAVARGIVILRFFAPVAVEAAMRDGGQRPFFSQMVAAELIGDRGPDAPPQIIPLEVKRPAPLLPLPRRFRQHMTMDGEPGDDSQAVAAPLSPRR